MNFKIKLFDSLKSIYGNKVYDVDIDIKKLKNMGWFSKQNTKRPDFLIFDKENECVLVELKEIVEKEEDIKVKNELAKMRTVSYWVPDMKNQLKRIINTANRQFKEFISNHHEKINLESISVKTILAVHCNRFMLHNTVTNFEEILYGDTMQTLHQNENVSFSVYKKILNAETYTSTALFAIWNGKDGFSIYDNFYYKYQNNSPFFLTKNDTNYFKFDDFLSVFSGVRIRIYDVIKYDMKFKRKYKLNHKWIYSKEFLKTLMTDISSAKDLVKQQRMV